MGTYLQWFGRLVRITLTALAGTVALRVAPSLYDRNCGHGHAEPGSFLGRDPEALLVGLYIVFCPRWLVSLGFYGFVEVLRLSKFDRGNFR